MKCDVHITVFCSVIFILLMYYYECQRRMSASLNAEEGGRSSSDGKRMHHLLVNDEFGKKYINAMPPKLLSENINTDKITETKSVEIRHLTRKRGFRSNFRSNGTITPSNAGISSDYVEVLGTHYLKSSRGNSVRTTESNPNVVNEEERSLNVRLEPGAIQMKNIFETHKLTKSQDNLFFVETSWAIDGRRSAQDKVILKPRQACAIYSTAYHNPSKHVILIVALPDLRNFYYESPAYMKAVFDLPNFYVAPVNLTEMYEHTPLSAFLNGGLRQSAYPVEHNADILRILLIYLFGGTYIDLDFVSVRPLDDLGINYMGAEVFDSVGTAVFNFEARHPYLKEYLSVAHQAYSAQEWTSVGPALATSVLIKFCKLTLQESKSLTSIGFLSGCGIRLLNDKAFYPISHWNWTLYMNDTAWPLIHSYMNQTYAFHVWNHKSASTPIKVGSNQPYAKLADRNCPPVYRQCGDVF